MWMPKEKEGKGGKKSCEEAYMAVNGSRSGCVGRVREEKNEKLERGGWTRKLWKRKEGQGNGVKERGREVG